MTWMNEYEIDNAVELLTSEAPEVAPYAMYLQHWKNIVNENSDGWPYWAAASKAASKLQTLIDKSTKIVRGWDRGEHPTEGELRAALTPIKSLATKHKLPQPELGTVNTYRFGR